VDPSDVVQDALANAASRLDDYLRDRPLPFYPWLRQLAWDQLVRLHHRHVAAGRRSLRRARVDLGALSPADSPDDLFSLHDALEQLEAHDPVKAKLVELRFFGGLTLEQAAECLDISLSTADRGWRYARVWRYAAMSGDDSEKK
jgi:DNA-directed RNA polymerase specialized sigma24 family protein